MSFFESKLINLNGNVTGILPVANGGPQMPTVNCYVYVSDTGSDVTGNGTYNNPFATTTAALAIITDATATKRYGVHIKGTISETNIYLKPYVWYYGDSWGMSRLNSTGGNITLSPGAFTTGNSRCGIYNVYLTGSTGINLDFVAQTASGSHVIEMATLGVNGSITSNPNNTNQYFQWEGDSLVFGNMTLHGALGLIFNTFLIGNLTVDQMAVPQATGGVNFASFFVGGNVTHSTSGSFANPIQMTACTIAGTLGITGTGATLTADAISLPLKAQITLSTGGAIVRTTDVNALAYSPTTSANWNSVPTTDQAALDTLATSGVVKSQTQNLVLSSPNGAPGVPTFRALVAADVALASSTNALASATTTVNVSAATAPSAGQVLTATSSTAATWQPPATSGTVTSVGMTVPAFLSVSGSPVTGSGTLAVSLSGTALPVLNGGTGVTTSTGTGSVVLSNGPAISAADIDGTTASNTARITIPQNTTSNLNSLTRKAGTLVYDTTAAQLLIDDGTNLNAVGSGTGEKNYILSPSLISSWTASGAGITLANDSTVAELPRGFTTKTGIKVTGVSGSTAYIYYRFTLDEADYNRKLKVKFDMRPITGYVGGDMQVSVYSNTLSNYTGTSTRLATSSDANSIAAIPNMTGTYQTTIDTVGATAPYMELRIGLNATSTQSLVFSDTVVGPGTQPQGAVIGDWMVYTPTLGTGVRGTNTEKAYWRRVGSGMQILYTYLQTGAGTAGSGGYTWSLPPGYTIDQTEVSLGSSNIGNAYAYNGTTEYTGYVSPQTSTAVGLGLWSTISVTVLAGSSNISYANATQRVHFNCWVPIAEWAGNGTVNVVQNDIEYAASTSGTWDAAATAAQTVYGLRGAPITSALTGQRIKSVRFQTPIQPTDEILVEVDPAGNNIWVPVVASNINGVANIGTNAFTGTTTLASANTVGCGFSRSGTTATDVDVIFGRFRAATLDSSTTADWSDFSGGNWRVRKVASGQAVGFSQVAQNTSGLVKSAGQLLGTNTNDVAAAGYVGEIVQSIFSSSATTPTNGQWGNLSSVSLTAGCWICYGAVYNTRVASQTVLLLAISQNSNNVTSDHQNGYNVQRGDWGAWNISSLFVNAFIVRLAASATVYIKGQQDAGTFNTGNWSGNLTCVRFR